MPKGVFVINTDSKDPDQPAKIHSLIRNFTILRYVLQYPMFLYADIEGPARIRRLIWAFYVYTC